MGSGKGSSTVLKLVEGQTALRLDVEKLKCLSLPLEPLKY